MIETRTFWQQFHAEHGDSIPTGTGWLLFEDGAMRENSAMGCNMDPPRDPLERARKILQYRRLQLVAAEKQFQEFNEAALESNDWQWDDRAQETIKQLQEFREAVEAWREDVAAQQAIVNELDPRYMPPEEVAKRERLLAESRRLKDEQRKAYMDKLSDIKI